MTNQVYSDDELIEDAKRYPTRRAWKDAGVETRKAGGYSCYGAALHRGRDFMQLCCTHMPDERGGFRGYRYTDEQLLVSARQHQTRGAWHKSDVNMYQIARRRPVWDECVAHMLPAANLCARDYVVYAMEFSDQCCYVGLTVVPESRKTGHACRGPVFEHSQKTGLVPVFKVLESSLTWTDVGAAENRWQDKYKADGWVCLHTAKAGSLGSIRRTKWTREAVLAEAKKFTTKQQWIDGSQMSYRIAKREGWFDEASAHMPRRVLGIGLGRKVSAETRQKQREAKLGRRLSAEHRAKIAKAVKAGWTEGAVQV